MSEERMIEARDVFYSGLDNGEPRHWRDVGPDEIWEAAWQAAWNLRQQAPVPDWFGQCKHIRTTKEPVTGATVCIDCRSALFAAPKPEDVK